MGRNDFRPILIFQRVGGRGTVQTGKGPDTALGQAVSTVGGNPRPGQEAAEWVATKLS